MVEGLKGLKQLGTWRHGANQKTGKLGCWQFEASSPLQKKKANRSGKQEKGRKKKKDGSSSEDSDHVVKRGTKNIRVEMMHTMDSNEESSDD